MLDRFLIVVLLIVGLVVAGRDVKRITSRSAWWRYVVRVWIRERIERLEMAIAWRVPAWLVKWVTIRAVVEASRIYPQRHVPGLTADEIMRAQYPPRLPSPEQ